MVSIPSFDPSIVYSFIRHTAKAGLRKNRIVEGVSKLNPDNSILEELFS